MIINMLLIVAAAILALADQAVKYFVKINIPLGGRMEFIPGVLSLTHWQNTGAAFSLFRGFRWPLIVITVAFVAVIGFILVTKRLKAHPFGMWSLAVVLGGAVGNLIDRILYGYVVDMFRFEFINFPIFNLADVLVVIGGITACIYFMFYYPPAAPDAPAAPEAQGAPPQDVQAGMDESTTPKDNSDQAVGDSENHGN